MKRNVFPVKIRQILFFSLLASFMLCTTAMGQEQIAIPLSNPERAGQLNLSMIRGSLQVSGYDGSEVVIRYDSGQEVRREREETRNGMQRISGAGLGFEAYENNNTVTISNVSPMREMNFDILVPRNFSLKLSLVHGNNLHVENVNGDFEISHVNGEIILDNVSGSAMINTVNGNIKAEFRNISDDKPMAFSNVNGNIDVTLPANARLTAKMRTEWGDIFTDFEINMQREGNITRGSQGSGGYRIAVNNWVFGEINGGGPEYQFKTLHGDIFIRKR